MHITVTIKLTANLQNNTNQPSQINYIHQLISTVTTTIDNKINLLINHLIRHLIKLIINPTINLTKLIIKHKAKLIINLNIRFIIRIVIIKLPITHQLTQPPKSQLTIAHILTVTIRPIKNSIMVQNI